MRTLEEVYDCEHLVACSVWKAGCNHLERRMKCTHPALKQDNFVILTSTDVCRFCPYWTKRHGT